MTSPAGVAMIVNQRKKKGVLNLYSHSDSSSSSECNQITSSPPTIQISPTGANPAFDNDNVITLVSPWIKCKWESSTKLTRSLWFAGAISTRRGISGAYAGFWRCAAVLCSRRPRDARCSVDRK